MTQFSLSLYPSSEDFSFVQNENPYICRTRISMQLNQTTYNLFTSLMFRFLMLLVFMVNENANGKLCQHSVEKLHIVVEKKKRREKKYSRTFTRTEWISIFQTEFHFFFDLMVFLLSYAA